MLSKFSTPKFTSSVQGSHSMAPKTGMMHMVNGKPGFARKFFTPTSIHTHHWFFCFPFFTTATVLLLPVAHCQCKVCAQQRGVTKIFTHITLPQHLSKLGSLPHSIHHGVTKAWAVLGGLCQSFRFVNWSRQLPFQYQ